MALIKCVECGAEISERSTACVSCGAILPSLSAGKLELLKTNMALARSRRLGGLAFWMGVLWLFFSAAAGGPGAFASAWSTAIWLIVGGVGMYIAAEIARNLAERKARNDAKRPPVSS